VPLKGSEFDVDVDTVVFAIGQGANPLIRNTTPDLPVNKWGNILADDGTGATQKAGVFAGGDIVTGGATVISAMGAGRIAARAIDEHFAACARRPRRSRLRCRRRAAIAVAWPAATHPPTGDARVRARSL
jgi:NADPH-dependent glutamate synthase beta subunit-like oxidoreductase